MTKSRLKAFTLTELLVTLLLSSIVFALVWNSVRYLRRYQLLIEDSVTQLTAVNELESYLMEDMVNSSGQKIVDGQLVFHTNFDTTTYLLSDTLVMLKKDSTTILFEAGLTFFEEDFLRIEAGNYRKDIKVEWDHIHLK